MEGEEQYQKCLMAMKQARQETLMKSRELSSQELQSRVELSGLSREDMQTSRKTIRGSIIASMVPDEIILQHSNYSIRSYETALMFIDVSGFTDLCERYTKENRAGPSRLTQVLNAYIGAMVQEILSHGGDVLNFSGDAFLSMWKKSPIQSLQNVVHSAIDCGLSVQKNYGTYHTDVGVVLKVKIAISAGISHFSLIGDDVHSHYVIIGQPVWDVKNAQNLASAGDVITGASAWMFANETKYIVEPLGDGRHTRILRTGVTWKATNHTLYQDKELFMPSIDPSGDFANYYREFSLRPVIVSVLRKPWWISLSKFIVKPVIRAVENDEPMEFLTEIRRVVIVFLNIITSTVTDELLIDIVNTAFKCVYSISSESDGLLNKVSMFDKDLMFLLIFGLRGITNEDDAEKGLLCAQTLKESLVDPNIISVSIGISSGTTYCGVVGHVLRREYTVIGSAVNKAARLMMAYPNKVTCDKETVLRSKMDQEFFRLLEFKPMKGIKKPGPVYEFNKNGWPEWQSSQRHPLLGRDKELRAFLLALQKAMTQMFTSNDDQEKLNEDLVYGVVFLGPKLVGKTRLMEECIHLTPNCVRVVRITLSKTRQVPYGLFRQIALKILSVSSSDREELENAIESSLDVSRLSHIQVYAINLMFDCNFYLPESFEFTGDILSEYSVKNLLQEFLKNNIPSLWIVAIEEAMYIDDESWRILLILLDSKTIFVLMNIEDTTFSDIAHESLATEKLLKMPLSGLAHSYHSALACQFLDVQAIPVDLEKIIQSASNGMPGWIVNFIISLVQQGDLSVETETRAKAVKNGAMLPPPSLLYRKVDTTLESDSQNSLNTYFEKVLKSLNHDDTISQNSQMFTEQPNDFIQIAVLADTYEVFHVKKMSIDAMILKTYDSLAPFEKMLLKCGSVLGVVFSRHMVQYFLQSDSPRKIAEAVAKLFSIEVLECDGGDFTQRTSKVLIHSSPELQGAIPPFCSCLGITKPDDCADLPEYAFCGYMRFKHPLFRTTIYELLTESQKLEMHARALFYLEFHTRRCRSCGSGCFHRFMGKRSNDGLMNESDGLKNTRRMIREMAAETKEGRIRTQSDSSSLVDFQFRSTLPFRLRSDKSFLTEGSEIIIREPSSVPKDSLSVRSFSSLDLENCECLAIVLFVYDQIINHCRGSGEHEKLFESYLEYADLCVMNSNIPLALRLLNEVEGFVLNDTYWCKKPYNNIRWVKDMYLGRILSLRGQCMLEIEEHVEARKHLYRALELFCDPFPTTKFGQMICNVQASIRQWRTLKITPKLFIGKERDFVVLFYEDVAVTLTRLYKLFAECKDYSNAELAAKWSLIYGRRNNANFQLLCESYGNMISIHLKKHKVKIATLNIFSLLAGSLVLFGGTTILKHIYAIEGNQINAIALEILQHSKTSHVKFSKCVELEKLALEVCHRKRGVLDAAEMRAVCVLYTSVFSFYVENGKKNESLAYGLPVLQMVSKLTDPGVRVCLIIRVMNLLLSDLRITEIVLLMKDPLYLDDLDQYDLSSTIWYYFYSMVILIETGYTVESYHKCERFYLSNGDAILQSKSKEGAWYYFCCMWLMTVRLGAWERSVLWEGKVKQIMHTNQIDQHIYMRLLLLEGLLIILVRQIDSRNASNGLQRTIKDMFRILRKCCQRALIFLPRYLLLLAYFNQIRGKTIHASSYLQKTRDLAKGFDGILVIWAEHTRQHWTGTLAAGLEDYWTEHVQSDDLLDYRDFAERKQIIPYTLPLPKNVDG